MSVFAPAALSYTSYQGKQVALPVLTDAYGLYYNKTMFAKAGLTDPPKTMSELMDYAKKLTVRDANGDIKIAGFVPLDAFDELGPSDLAHAWGAKWFDSSNRQSSVRERPRLDQRAHLAEAARRLVRQRRDHRSSTHAWVDKEWTPDQAFETGHVAMILDGEWRTRMIANDQAGSTTPRRRSRPPTTTRPVRLRARRRHDHRHPERAKHPDDAWVLVKYMATDTDFLVKLANGLGNVPTTKARAASPDLVMPPQMKTFIDVWNNPNSVYSPPLTAAARPTPTSSTVRRQVGRRRGARPAGRPGAGRQEVANELALGQAP